MRVTRRTTVSSSFSSALRPKWWNPTYQEREAGVLSPSTLGDVDRAAAVTQEAGHRVIYLTF
jgi:hypothetical protein